MEILTGYNLAITYTKQQFNYIKHNFHMKIFTYNYEFGKKHVKDSI